MAENTVKKIATRESYGNSLNANTATIETLGKQIAEKNTLLMN